MGELHAPTRQLLLRVNSWVSRWFSAVAAQNSLKSLSLTIIFVIKAGSRLNGMAC